MRNRTNSLDDMIERIMARQGRHSDFSSVAAAGIAFLIIGMQKFCVGAFDSTIWIVPNVSSIVGDCLARGVAGA